MNQPLKAFFRRLVRRGQRGQALVILAIGFVGLLGFVGIVTDVSLLFIRYSTMRRAVDAASVAAAGQMRRVLDTSPTDGIAQDEAGSVANLSLAARQFIQVYGLNPTNVIVETCRAQQVRRDPIDNSLVVDRTGIRLFLANGDPNPAANAEDVARFSELCTDLELKLVRVTAQIESPTIFMRLLGYDTITLTESSISQTAVIDVVLIMDVSESMLNETTYASWDTLTPRQGVRYMPPYINESKTNPIAPALVDPWEEILNNTQSTLNSRTNYTLATVDAILGDKTEAFEPNSSGIMVPYVDLGSGLSANSRQQPPEFCRVRAYNGTVFGSGPSYFPTWLRNEYASYFGSNYGEQFDELNPAGDAATYPHLFSGFVPMYNFYGCCNDPNLDFQFDDLICEPFREARDAAGQFLERLDFLRGDRVGFVTFDRIAYAVDPDGNGAQDVMIETQNNLNNSSGVLIRKGASETLRDLIGVRSEPSAYTDFNFDGNWDGFVDGLIAADAFVNSAATSATRRDVNNLMTGVTIGAIFNHPVAFSCPLDNAMIDNAYEYTIHRTMPDGSPRYVPLLDGVAGVVAGTFPAWESYNAGKTYQYRAICAGTNIGGAVAAGSSTLYGKGRREGAVWIMVLMSDGAAGSTNPVSRDGGNPAKPDIYNITGGNNVPLAANPANRAYGAFGLCPYGTQAQPSELLTSGAGLPFCQDIFPEARRFCNPTAAAQLPSQIVIDAATNCYEFYNVDDFARDWADWVGLAELPGAFTGTGSSRVTEQQLPTIFAIGFGLNFANDTDPNTLVTTNSCTATGGTAAQIALCERGGSTPNTGTTRARRQDYLGEELLRYIADVGDNNQIDSDYWQWHMPGRIGNDINTSSAQPEWGARGPCEQLTWVGGSNQRGDNYLPLDPTIDCGNYYAATSGAELEIVFNEIASRMFTRLSQ